jgi:hypothetical protein
MTAKNLAKFILLSGGLGFCGCNKNNDDDDKDDDEKGDSNKKSELVTAFEKKCKNSQEERISEIKVIEADLKKRGYKMTQLTLPENNFNPAKNIIKEEQDNKVFLKLGNDVVATFEKDKDK